MKLGVKMERGPQDWQIIQQKDGFGAISACGMWHYEDGEVRGVYARIVKEDSGEIVIPWQRANDLPGRRWEITVEDIPAGGLYRFETCLARVGAAMEWAIHGDMAHFLGVGDLYVITGQSNAAGYGKDPIFDAPELGVHLFANSNRWKLAAHPLNDTTDSAHEINNENSNPGNSPYLSFAKLLKRELHYPIGLIQTSLGGSPLSRWNPEETGDLYANMMEVIKAAGGSVKGVLWYQGCSDVGEKEAETYLARFGSMVRHMREALKDENLPVITVQLDRCTLLLGTISNMGYSKVRDAQRRAAREIPGVLVTPALDLTLSDCIHVSASANLVLGERMARLALQKIYGRRIGAEAPDLVSAIQTDNTHIRLQFAPVYDHLYCFEVPADKLSLEAEDEAGIISLADYRIEDDDKIVLELSRECEGQVFVHHARRADPVGRWPLDFATHLPALAFYRVPVRKEYL